MEHLAADAPGRKLIHPQYGAKTVDEAAAGHAIFLCDLGTPTIWAAHCRKRLLSSLRFRTGKWRRYPGDGGFAMLMGDMLSL